MKVWNWEGFWSYFTNLYLLEGALWTIGLTISTLILGGLIGLLLAVMRLSKHKALSRTAQTLCLDLPRHAAAGAAHHHLHRPAAARAWCASRCSNRR